MYRKLQLPIDRVRRQMLIEDADGESPPPPGIHHFVARPADIKQDFAGFCRNLLNFGTFQQDLSIIDQN